MKLKLIVTAILASIIKHLAPREITANAVVPGDVGVHSNGIIPLKCITAALATRYLLVQKGTNDDEMIANIATTRPWGVLLDEVVVGDYATVALLGVTPGTVKMVANAAVTAGGPVYTAAAGKVSPTYGATLFLVGRAVTSAAADGDLIEVMHTFPLINPDQTL